MKSLFWVSAFLIFYIYAGYPLWLWFCRARYSSANLLASGLIQPRVSVVMAIHNEEANLPRKLDNLLYGLDYDHQRIEFIIVSDGSKDGTNKILQTWKDPRLSVVLSEQREGKASALNKAMKFVNGDVVVFTDVRQVIERGAVRHIVQHFADPQVGCVSGTLMFGDVERMAGPLEGERVKMQVENLIRKWEGVRGRNISALGAFYAVRRSLVRSFPPGMILDDCFSPIEVIRQGYRSVFDEFARVWDDLAPTPAQELKRKIRTITGVYQLIRISPWILNPAGPVFWEFVNHKALRLIVPFAHLGCLIGAAMIPHPVYRAAFIVQLIGWSLAPLGLLQPKDTRLGRFTGISLTIAILNIAALVALFNSIMGRTVAWAGRGDSK